MNDTGTANVQVPVPSLVPILYQYVMFTCDGMGTGPFMEQLLVLAYGYGNSTGSHMGVYGDRGTGTVHLPIPQLLVWVLSLFSRR